MATNRIIIGSEDCRILKVTSLLKLSQSFHLFHDHWALIAIDLETGRDLVKTLQRDYLLKTIGLVDIVNGLLEDWVGRKSEDATLQKFVRLLEENGMKDCADSVVKGIKGIQNQNALGIQETKKYWQLPDGLPNFLKSNQNLRFCTISTLDPEITCEKIRENVENCDFLDWREFLNLVSGPKILNKKLIVRNLSLDYSKNLNRALQAIQGDCKVTFVIQEPFNNSSSNSSGEGKIEHFVDSMSWDDLTPSYQLEITDKLEKNYKVKLANELLAGQVLVDLINGKELKLFRETLPPEISYYVERTISTRHIISFEIFDQASPDIFLFTGIDRYELSKLAKTKLTGTSGSQLREKNITANYLILDHPNDFQKVYDICPDLSSVHLLHYDNGRLRWMQSKGNLKTIQKFVNMADAQEELDEPMFISNLSVNLNQPIIISDSPGMGKSILLGKFGKDLNRKHPERLVFFATLSEFIGNVKVAETGQGTRAEAIQKALRSMICESIVGEAVFEMKLNLKEIAIELLLDGFDEVEMTQFELAYDVLTTLASYKSVRLWVTARPHLLEKLENNLLVLGFKITPLEDLDQIKLLSSCWSKDGQLSTSKLEKFARVSLKMLKSKLKSTEQDIAGIPLQCLMLGQVLEEEALAHAESDQVIKLNSITSLTHLYKLLIARKIEKYLTVHVKSDFCGTEALMNMHVKLSLELIFPEFVDKLNKFISPIQMEELLKVGILELSSTDKSPKFLHRTFAEYFLAWFAVNKLIDHGWNDPLVEYVFDGMLCCKPVRTPFLLNRHLRSLHDFSNPKDRQFEFEFAYPVITHFFNDLVITILQNVSSKESSWSFIGRPNFHTTAFKITRASTYQNFGNVLKLFQCFKVLDQHSSVFYNKWCLFLAIQHAELELVKLVLKHFEQHHTFTADIRVQTLHRAISRGKFSIVEFLIKEKGLRSIVENFQNGGPSANEWIHACVEHSDIRSPPNIEERVQILRMLVGINRELLEERRKSNDLNTPLLEPFIHVDLRIELLQLGANLLAPDSKGCTILHKVCGVSCEDYHTFLFNVDKSCLRQLMQMKEMDGKTPLLKLVEYLDPLPETLTVFKNAEANFNVEDKFGLSVLATAVRFGRNSETLRNLIEHGSNIDWLNSGNGNSLLHIAAEYGNIEAVKFLGEMTALDLNAENNDGDTALDWVIKRAFAMEREGNIHYNVIDCGLILHRLGAKFNKIKDCEGFSPLHVAAHNGNYHIIPFLVNVGVDVNLRDANGYTALHHCMEWLEEHKQFYATAKSLLKHDANPNLVNGFGETPFHIAMQNGKVELKTYQMLISKTDTTRIPAVVHLWLHLFCSKKHENVENKLNSFERECADDGIIIDWECEDDDGNSLLHLAVDYQCDEVIKFLVEGKQVQLNSRNNLGQTVLHKGAVKGDEFKLFSNFDILLYLIDHGADAYAVDESGLTFLHIYIEELYYPNYFDLHNMIMFLARKNFCSLFEITGGVNSSTPLQLLVSYCEIEEKTLALLQASGVNLNTVDKDGDSILHYAIGAERSKECISNLIRFGADWKILNNKHDSVLHASAEVGNLETLKVFLELGGLDVNGVDMVGNTPLHVAMYHTKNLGSLLEICQTLIEGGAQINIRNKLGYTPLAMALIFKYQDVTLLRLLDNPKTSSRDAKDKKTGTVKEQDWVLLVLQLIRVRLDRLECEDVMEASWSAMWNATSETRDCEKFVENDGIDLLSRCLHAFPKNSELLMNLAGTATNVANDGRMRKYLMNSELISTLCKLLDFTEDDGKIRFSAAGVLASLLSDGEDAWIVSDPDREVICQSLVKNISSWDINYNLIIDFGSSDFKNLLNLLQASHTVECQLYACSTLAYFTTIDAEQYVPLLEKEIGLTLLKELTSDTFLQKLPLPTPIPSTSFQEIKQDVKKFAEITIQNVQGYNGNCKTIPEERGSKEMNNLVPDDDNSDTTMTQ